MLTMMMTNANNNNANANASALRAEAEEESDSMSMMSSEEEEESEEDNGEEMDSAAGGAYVSLFAVADRMERWYANGARECPEDHVMRVEALLRR